jgi:hypothetical protein
MIFIYNITLASYRPVKTTKPKEHNPVDLGREVGVLLNIGRLATG